MSETPSAPTGVPGNNGAGVKSAPVDSRLSYTVADNIATIGIERGHKMNALLPEMILNFSDLIERARRDSNVRAVVIRGAGKNFCAGDDLNPEDRFRYGPPDLHTRLKMGYPRLINDILQLRKPVIAMVRGYAVGAGFDLSLACDFRIAAPDTKMAAIYVKRGLGGGCSYLLPRYVGFGKATELMLLGDMIDAEEALRLHLITRLVPEEKLEEGRPSDRAPVLHSHGFVPAPSSPRWPGRPRGRPGATSWSIMSRSWIGLNSMGSVGCTRTGRPEAMSSRCRVGHPHTDP